MACKEEAWARMSLENEMKELEKNRGCRYKETKDARELAEARRQVARLMESNAGLAAQVKRLTEAADDTSEDMQRMAAESRKLRSEIAELKGKLNREGWQRTVEEEIERHVANIRDEARAILRWTLGMEPAETKKVQEDVALKLTTLAEWVRDK